VGLVPLEDVQAHVMGAVVPLEPVAVPLADALGLVLAEDAVADELIPPFANSAMDGYAVRALDCTGASDTAPVRLAVVGEVAAGASPTTSVGPGEAVRIMTGAPVPDGADAVVIVEHTRLDGDTVVVTRPAGAHIRAAGGDVAPGDVVLPAGTLAGPAQVGVLASLGRGSVMVRRRARLGVLSTGDELAGPGEPLAPGKIRESNRPMLLAAAALAGCDPTDLGVVPDDEASVRTALERGVGECDALVTSGGVSVGEYDFVREVLAELAGGDMRWFQVAIKPAKPFAFGLMARTDGPPVPVFGLPGNPVSSYVSFELFARPALRAMMGDPRPFRPVVSAVAEAPLRRRADGKVHFDRVWVRWSGDALLAVPSGVQESNVLSALGRANGLAVLPDGEGVDAGEPVAVMLLELPPGPEGGPLAPAS